MKALLLLGVLGVLPVRIEAAEPTRSVESASIAPLTTAPDATVLRDGAPFRGIGVNYFDCFLRTLKDGSDTSYDAGFATLKEHGIPFARFCATGFWPADMKLYLENRDEYFRRMDGVVRSAEKHGVGLIPSLFWHCPCVPDLVGEPVDQWANPQSKTRAWMARYVGEVVTRYRSSPSVWMWEMGNEHSLGASLPNAAQHRPQVVPKLGTPAHRSERDELTFEIVRQAFTGFATEVRSHDPLRLIGTGDSFPRLSAWHQEHEGTWTQDSPQQFREMLALANPDPVSAISVHAYEDDGARFPELLAVSRRLGKPLFVGEFGAQGSTPEQAAKFHGMLQAIVRHPIPLAALWVFDYPRQEDFNITAGNDRAYQLQAIAAANRTLRAQSED